jgi:RNA polymerase sigma-70 factor (ECF subfamily)
LHSSLPYNEKELLHQIAQGDEAAFSTLFYSYYAKLQPFIMKLTRSAADTEECIQETFIRIWMNRDKLEEIQNPAAWIFTVASNECYKYLKKRITREHGLLALGKGDPYPEHDQSTLHAIQLKEVAGIIASAVSQLPTQRKRIYQMSRDGGMKIPEIATHLKISPHTVKNALVHSLSFIRKYLADRGHEL